MRVFVGGAVRKKTGYIQQRGERSFRIRYVNNDGIRQSETITGAREDAERELAIRLGEIAKGLPVSSKPNTVLFGELADDVLTDYEVNGYESAVHAETRFRLHLIPVFGKRKAASITTAQIKIYVVQRQKAGASTGTVNRELQLMRHTFRLASQGRKLFVMPHVPMLRETNVRTGFFTREEVERLCSHLKAPLNSFVLFGFLTGWRLDEIRNLKWSNVDFAAGEIRLDVGTTKNKDGRVFPMTTEIRELLTNLKTKAKAATTPRIQTLKPALHVDAPTVATLTPFVFVIRRRPIGAFRKTWRNACHKAGLPCIVGKDGKVLKALRIFHDLRRSAARELQRQGFTEGQIMRLMGHKTRSMFDRYQIVTDDDLREKIAALDQAKAIHASSAVQPKRRN
jgi:integrase